MSMYLRLKRKNQTVFMHVEPSDSFASIKQRIAELFDEVDATGIMLLNTDKKELVDMASVSDQELASDDVVYMVFKRPGSEQWEELQVDKHAAPTDLTNEANEG